MRCPNCGSPVMVRGNRWECGWCGDFGFPAQEAALPRADDAALFELERGTLSVLKGVRETFGDGEAEKGRACKLAVYGMSRGLLPAEKQSKTNLRLLQAFFQRYPFCTAGEVLAAARSGKPAFEDQFLLTGERLGPFWEALLSKLPLYSRPASWPDWLCQIVEGLCRVESVFSGEDRAALFETIEAALDAHWSAYRLLHPDRAALEDAVGRWDFSENEWACRDLLAAAFPEAAGRWPVKELLDMDVADLLLGTGRRDPETAIQMMKLLLNTAERHLRKTGAAEQLLGNDLHDFCLERSVHPSLLAQLKQDTRLACQLFQSAYVGAPQEAILNACRRLGEPELQKTLLALLDWSPCSHGFLEVDLCPEAT